MLLRAAAFLRHSDRLLLAIYLIALLGLLMLPIPGASFEWLGVGSDKWMHLVLFAGLAVFLRWNFLSSRHGEVASVGIAIGIAVATEAAQGLVNYRSAESWDALAGSFGVFLGTFGMNRILSLPAPAKAVGLIVVILGLVVAAIFILADVIGVGKSIQFGTLQMAGAALGLAITAGGFLVYRKGLPDQAESR
jgi:hypothetical protein